MATKAILRTLRNLRNKALSQYPFLVRTKVVGGAYIYVDLKSAIGRTLFLKGAFDMAVIEPVLDALRPGDTFLDVGSNIGFYSILASGKVGSTGTVVGFEVDDRPLKVFLRTLNRLDLPQIRVVPAAVYNVDGLVSMVPEKEHGHSHVNPVEAGGSFVRAVRLDTYVSKFGIQKVSAIKIDVEGAEKRVLEGAVETITSHRPLIVCEASGLTERFGYEAKDILEMLKSLGYRTEWMEGVWTPTILAKPC